MMICLWGMNEIQNAKICTRSDHDEQIAVLMCFLLNLVRISQFFGDYLSASFIVPLRLSNDPMTLVMLTVQLPKRAEELCYWAEDLDMALVTSFGYRNLGGGLLTVQCVSAIIVYIYIYLDI